MLHFLGIGAQKAGTTWLYAMLSRHPGIRFPAGKEVHFWDQGDLSDLSGYRSLFAQADGDRHRLGEITPAYAMLAPEQVRRIHRELPALRLVYLIRNPMDRAWSSALMALKRAEMTLEEASDQWFTDHFRSLGSLRRGDYEACIRTWSGIYPRAQLLIERYDAIRAEPRALLARVAEHLGVDASPLLDLPDEVVSKRVFAGTGCPIRPALCPVLEELYRDKVRRLGDYLGTDLGWL
jgi:hypothetical protein